MTDKFFSDWDELTKAVNKKCEVILKKYVAPVAEEIFKKHIQSDIYDVYQPIPNAWVGGTTYRRRHILEKRIKVEISSNESEAELFITSTAPASESVVKGYRFKERYDGAFLKLIESGNMGIWRKGFPRPAVSNTQMEFDNGKDVQNAMLIGINNEIGKSVKV